MDSNFIIDKKVVEIESKIKKEEIYNQYKIFKIKLLKYFIYSQLK